MSTKDKYKQFVNTAFVAAVEPVVIEKAEGVNYYDEDKISGLLCWNISGKLGSRQ